MLATETTDQKTLDQPKIRLSMVMDRDLHRRVRIEALERDISMRKYVESILKRRHELDQNTSK